MATKWQNEIQGLQAQAHDDHMTKMRLQMELDCKDSEIEQLQIRLASLSSETASLSSGGPENDDEQGILRLVIDIKIFKQVYS